MHPKLTAILTLVFPCAITACLSASASFLVHNGASDYVIVLDDAASASERFAAEELQTHFEACTGVSLPIVGEPPESDTPMIVLGAGATARSLGVSSTPEALGEQGYVMRTVTPHLVIAGTPEAGTLYGVYDFLEEQLGVRWHAPGVTKTPTVETLPLPEIDVTVKPAFLWRHTSYAWPGKDDAFLARMRDNNGSGGADHPYGIQHHHDGRCHSYFRFISPDEYFEEHPEYFSEIGGLRRSHETQLCLTNPEVLDIVTEKMLQRMAEQPHTRQHNFSQMDYYNYCQCDACATMNAHYGTLGGTQFWFVNQLAERTAKVYPDKFIGTLAYMYTEEPPRDLVMHPNVVVWLCHMFPSCDSHPIATCPLDADYKRRAEAWSAITSNLYIWHYIVNFAHYYAPFPNFRVLAEDLRFYRDIGVSGIYLQGMSERGGGGEFSLLRPWYVMQLAWNPDRNADALLKDFLQGYYRHAWEPIYQYLMLLENVVQDQNIHMHLYTNPAQGYLPDAVLDRADALFDLAEKQAADDEELLEAVRVARMPVVYARLFPRNGYIIEDGLLRFQGPLASLDATAAFVNRMEQHGFKSIRERQGDPDQLLLLGLLFGAPLDTPQITNDYLSVDAAPLLGGRMLRVIERNTGVCVTGYNITRNLFFPFCGGEETRIGGIYDIEGMFYQFEVTDHTQREIAMEADVGHWRIRRAISLDADAPVVRVQTSVENTSDRPRETIVRSHTNLDLGPLDTVRVQFINRRGKSVERDMKPIIAGLREGESYHDLDAPRNEWRLTGGKGVEIIQRFDDGQLDFAWLYAYPDYLNDLEAELWAKPVILEPGQTATLTHEIEVRPVTPLSQ